MNTDQKVYTSTASAKMAAESTFSQTACNEKEKNAVNIQANEERKRLHITHVDSLGPYLKISGHLNPDIMKVVRNQIQTCLANCYAIDPTWPVTRQQALLLPGAMCLYKRINDGTSVDFEFVRARIKNVIAPKSPQATPQVDVEVIDYGYMATVVSFELLFPQQPEQLQNIPATCSEYIVLGICEDWKRSQLDEISRTISQHTVDISIIKEFNQFKFIIMKWKDFNLAEYLILQKKMGAPIENDLLFDNFEKIVKDLQPQEQKQQQLPQKQFPSSNNNNNNAAIFANSNLNNNNNNYRKNQGLIDTITSGNGGAASPNNNLPVNDVNTVKYGLLNLRRPLDARLQQLQHPQQYQPLKTPIRSSTTGINAISSGISHLHNPMMVQHVSQPFGTVRPMMTGIQVQNNRFAYSGIRYQQVFTQQMPHMPPVNTPPEYNNGYHGSVVYDNGVSKFNMYKPRYQRPSHAMAIIKNQEDYINRATSAGPATPPLASAPRRFTSATFKSNSLTVGQMYDVSVSFVENGPFLFSVQLVGAQNDLTDMMNKIEKVTLKQFSEKPMLGTACIARYSEDGQLYRALITGVQPLSCKVAYIDYGNAEIVQYNDLYEIPEDFLTNKAFAIRFTLSGHKELEPIDESLKKAFKDLVIYKNCKLKVMPLEGPPLVQYCELYLQEKNILDVLKQIQKSRLVYAKAEHLQNNDVVEIRYIDSPKNFYVQKVENIPAFEKLMDDMFLYYNTNQMVPNHLVLGAPCIVKYENEWFRAEVMRADSTAIVVRHVDFGYEQKVTKNLLSTIAENHLKLPRQAVQCCLKGFENNEPSKDLVSTQFEMLAEESNRQRRSFTVKVFRIQPDGVNLVNLCTKDLNVMKKLYKLSMPFEQYLTLEKEDFNIRSSPPTNHKNENQKLMRENEHKIEHKTPSTASSSDGISAQSSKKAIRTLNSTTLQNDERPSQLQQQLPNPNQKTQNRNTFNVNNPGLSSPPVTGALEWDKQSSNSSINDNRDSRSSSSEVKQQQHHKRQGHYNNNYNNNKNSFVSNKNNGSNHGSINSVASDKRSSTSSNNYGQRYQQNTPPRFQNKHKNQQQQKQQQRQQRSQNAPQGYSQNYNTSNANISPAASTVSASSSRSLPQQKEQQTAKQSHSNENLANTSTGSNNSVSSEDYMPLNKSFPVQPIDTPSREEITISWWVSPHQFFTQLRSRLPEFERLMADMQDFYHKKPLQSLQLKVGSHVMARHRKDNVIYRARILGCNQMLRKYKVLFVDYGNQYAVTSEDIWQVEKRFANFPIMAYLCGFYGIVSNYDHLYMIDRMDQYLPQGAILQCEYIECNSRDLYYVNVNVNKVPLKETLLAEGLITQISPELQLDLLAGQQVRAKVFSIKDMLNFKIKIPYGCDNIEYIDLLCSYDDIRFVKSNPDICKKFKRFYEDKSCVLNIKDVNDNKVLMLRPLLPLLKEDIPWYVCSPPLLLETFNVRIVYVASPYRLYGQNVATEEQMSQLLNEMYDYYENEGSQLESFELEQICAAKGSDSNWYRARIAAKHPIEETLEVYYIDYGNKERVEKQFLKRLEERFYLNQNAHAVEVNLPLKTWAADTHSKQKIKKRDSTSSSNASTNDLVPDIKIIKYLSKLCLDHVVLVKAIEVRQNRLMADVVMEDGKNIIDLLKEKEFVKGRDVEYMRKLLDKEKPNVLEYIETVDLTLEDEEDRLGEDGKHLKSKVLSPKKKQIMEKEKGPEPKEINEAAVIDKREIDEREGFAEQFSDTNVALPVLEIEDQFVGANKELPNIEEPLNNCMQSSEKHEILATPLVNKLELDPFAHMELAVLAHCDNPAQFFIHSVSKLKDLERLQENLQIVASSLPPLMRIIKDAYCISMYSVDKQWYRAKILDPELMVLQFIDFGNTDCITDTTDLKEMIVFPNIEPFCIHCALPIRPNGTVDWVDAANAIFNDSYNKILSYEFIIPGEGYNKRSFVNLFIDGVNVAEKLIKDGYARPLQLVDSGENCYISHVNSINDFYIQYEKDSKALELIEIYLGNYESLPNIKKFDCNKVVAALFPEDEMWYRAKLLKEIKSADSNSFEVLFIDYGNTSITAECREISKDIAELPALSQKCCLKLPENCLNWSEKAEEKFQDIAATGETIFSVELREPAADHAKVYLLIDGQNINDELEKLCERKPSAINLDMSNSFTTTSLQTSIYDMGVLQDAVVSHVNSPSDFYIQFAKDAIRLEDMVQTLNSLSMEKLINPEKHQLCAAKFGEDQILYRAKILEVSPSEEENDIASCRVLFIDYGNEALSCDIKILPQDLLQLKPFAKHCQLENSHKLLELGGIATESFNTLLTKCDGSVKLEIVGEQEFDATNSCIVVRLYAADTEENIFENLYKTLGVNNNNTQVINTNPFLESFQKTCVISHAVSPMKFFIQLKSNSPKMDLITKTLKNMISIESLKPINRPVVGRVCVTYSTEDECYYRGRISRVLSKEEGVEIFLLDYGNFLISQDIKEMPIDLYSIPSLALNCQLNAIPSVSNEEEESLLNECFLSLLETHFGEIYEIQTEQYDEEKKVYYVKLQVNYKDLAEELTRTFGLRKANKIEETFSPLPTLHNCSVIHVNSTQSFYVQFNDDIASLEHITDALLDAGEEFPVFTELKVGALCAAQFPDDGAYYRAKIINVLEDEEVGKCEVHYLDFGNNSITDQFRQLPPELIKKERFSQHCSLEATCPPNEEMNQTFINLIDQRFSETFQLEFLKKSESLNIVRLFYQEKNILHEMQQLLREQQLQLQAAQEVNGFFLDKEGNASD
ncbi:tudor domain containing protein isoform 1-T2 [Glossina fuscipes fuscipes]